MKKEWGSIKGSLRGYTDSFLRSLGCKKLWIKDRRYRVKVREEKGFVIKVLGDIRFRMS